MIQLFAIFIVFGVFLVCVSPLSLSLSGQFITCEESYHKAFLPTLYVLSLLK